MTAGHAQQAQSRARNLESNLVTTTIIAQPSVPPAVNDNLNRHMALIARLHADGDISTDERDAAEIYSRMGCWLLSRPTHDGSAHIPQRTADGKWSRPLMRGQDILSAYNAANAAIRTDNRRRAVTLALVARDEGHYEPAALSCGLEDLAAHYWPVARATTSRATTHNGITMPRLKSDEFDATPERIAQATAGQPPEAANDNTIDGARRVFKSPFARMYDRGQLSPVPDTNEALYAAGLRYYQDWFYAGLSGIKAIDYSRVGTGESSAAHMMPRTEREAARREAFRDAVYALDKMQRDIMEAVVLQEGTLDTVGRPLDLRGRREQVRAQAKALLVGALGVLRKHYDTPPGQQIRWRKAA